MTHLPKGFTLHDGPSAINGAPILALMQLRTGNRKTGDVPTVYFLPRDEEPHTATQSGLDVAVCGGCQHRPLADQTCYVNAWEAPRSVYTAWQQGLYPEASVDMLRDALSRLAPRMLRLGGWGDPLSAPLILPPLVATARALDIEAIGYTQRWNTPGVGLHKGYLMASVNSAADGLRARSKGWRTFRIRPEDGPLGPAEQVCDYEESAYQCRACRACNGAESSAPSVVATVHGLRFKKDRFTRRNAAKES